MIKARVPMFVIAMVFCREAYADQFHYNNVLMGDRASGLGGAFGAVSDDASGVHYNPAGLAFALSNDISGSANAIYQRKVTYKKAAFGKDFTEHSSGTMAPFFGALGKLDHLSPGMVFAFGYMTLDSDLKDQDDLIQPTPNVRFHRTANVRANTNKFGLAVAKRWGGSFAAGFGVNYLWVDELSQIYQDSTDARQGYKVDDDGNRTTDADGNPELGDVYYRTLTQNIRERLQANAIEPSLGVQYAFLDQFAVGFTVKKPIVMAQKYEVGMERTVHYYDTNNKVVDVSETGITTAENDPHRDPASPTAGSKTSEKNPLGDMPMELRLGFAWFASTTLLVTSDIIHHTAVAGDVDQYERSAVTDFALGGEYYVMPSFPVRLGLFTNNDARPKPSASKANQPDSIDYTGTSLFVAFVQPNSQVALGAIMQQGKGKSQKVANSKTIQDVEALAWSAGFSVSHNF